jgi:hypothetical protein
MIHEINWTQARMTVTWKGCLLPASWNWMGHERDVKVRQIEMDSRSTCCNC